MLFKKQKQIPCYVLVFDQVEIIRKSLDFLTNLSDKLEIIVIENPSENTPAIQEIVKHHGEAGRVSRYYLFDQNITGNAYDIVFHQELSHIKQNQYVVVTDGDLVCESNQWLNEEIRVLHQNNDVFACGVSLERSNLPTQAFPDAINWIPADLSEQKDYYEAYTGGHLLMFRGQDFYDFLLWKDEKMLNFVDSEMHKYSRDVLGKKWARTKQNSAYHLTWDLYQDKNNAYTKLKTNTSFQDTWFHQRKATYAMTSFVKRSTS